MLHRPWFIVDGGNVASKSQGLQTYGPIWILSMEKPFKLELIKFLQLVVDWPPTTIKTQKLSQEVFG